ncbi:MAG TPA: hypothetical protein VMM85_01750 [Methylomirabilota bacterium]|nr:hypothetical protein [Methylomirabilota bacterium]
MPPKLRGSIAPLIILLSMLLTLTVATPVAAKKNPPGNNGTVKIDALEFDKHPNNQPHVGCIFEVDFYGFDEGDLWADVTFTAHPPTGGGVLLHDRVFIGDDDNSGGGSQAGWDASAEYDLSQALAGYPVHRQGYHVKLTVNADGSQGADTKHKVFWVQPCAAPPPDNGPPDNGPPDNGPREDTAGGSGGPSVPALPDTATDATRASGMLVLGVLFASGALALGAASASSRRARR